MQKTLISRNLIKAVITMVILLYFVHRTTSHKIIFAPFLICSFASIGKNLGMLFHKKRLALFWDRVFKIVFFLSWFGFLTVACYVIMRNGNYSKLLFTVPFWLGGIFLAKRKFHGRKDRET